MVIMAMSIMSIITTGTIMARKKLSADARALHLSPRAGRGRRSSEARASGEGASRALENIDTPPHPARSEDAARHLLPAGGEKEESALSSSALYRLMAWLSPAFPVGAFSYSSGIEWAVETGDIADEASLQAWLMVTLAQGGGFCDAVLFAQAHRAIRNNDDKALHEVAELAAAFAPSKERHLETTAQGNAFVEAARAAWGCAALDRLKTIWDGPVAYPVAVAVTASGHGIALEPSLAAYLQALAANWVSAGVRLIPLGQTQGLRVLAALEPAVTATAARARAAKLDDIGSSALRADLASARHETQYTRLFRS
jgi:urease accessory protein